MEEDEISLTSEDEFHAYDFLQHAAAGQLAELDTLLSEGLSVDQVDSDGFSALMIASGEGRAEVVKWLLDRNASCELRTYGSMATALHFSARAGNKECVRMIVERNKQLVHAKTTPDGDTPLIWACLEGHLDASLALLYNNSDPFVCNSDKATPLICAAMVFDYNEEGKPKADTTDDTERALIVKALLDASINTGNVEEYINAQDLEGSTALHLAAASANINCVKVLLNYKADITKQNHQRETALDEAKQGCMMYPKHKGYLQVYECLKKAWNELEIEAAKKASALLELEGDGGGDIYGGGAGKKKKKKNKKVAKKSKGKNVNQKPTLSSDIPADPATHVGIKCDNCFSGDNDDDSEEVVDIVGDRYKCLACEDFDLCSTCYISASTIHDSSHSFHKILPPNSITTVVEDALGGVPIVKHNQEESGAVVNASDVKSSSTLAVTEGRREENDQDWLEVKEAAIMVEMATATNNPEKVESFACETKEQQPPIKCIPSSSLSEEERSSVLLESSLAHILSDDKIVLPSLNEGHESSDISFNLMNKSVLEGKSNSIVDLSDLSNSNIFQPPPGFELRSRRSELSFAAGPDATRGFSSRSKFSNKSYSANPWSIPGTYSSPSRLYDHPSSTQSSDVTSGPFSEFSNSSAFHEGRNSSNSLLWGSSSIVPQTAVNSRADEDKYTLHELQEELMIKYPASGSDVSVSNLLGLGLKDLDFPQLEGLETILEDVLKKVRGTKIDLLRRIEYQRGYDSGARQEKLFSSR
jgi:ankyrin repeat protein